MRKSCRRHSRLFAEAALAAGATDVVLLAFQPDPFETVRWAQRLFARAGLSVASVRETNCWRGRDEVSRDARIGRVLARLVVAALATVFLITPGRSQQGPKFVGDLILKALPDGRNMVLVQPFTYVDSHNVSWPVPAGTKIDGASIPSVFWSIIGAPFTGKYREASVVHDYYCQSQSRHWKAVHKVFLDGMTARGVDSLQAKLMYIAVYRFGPRWNFDADACFCKGCPICANPIIRRVKTYQSKFNKAEFDDLKARLERGGGDLASLEQLADYQINTEIFRKSSH